MDTLKSPLRHAAHGPDSPTRPAARVVIRRLAWGVAAVSLLGMLAAGVYLAAMLQAAPSATELKRAQAARPSVMLSADGRPLTTFSPAQQQHVTLDQVPPHLLQALLATEDTRFYEHRGIDLRRTLAAVLSTARGRTAGGSTITQQLARNLFPEQIGRERSIERKIREMIAAVRLERHFSKRQILEAYLNNTHFLYNAVGIEMASRTYCDKPARALDLLESATLIGMLKGASYYNPVLHPERSRQRRNVVLWRMARLGMLPQAEYQQLSKMPLKVSLNVQTDRAEAAPHFVAHARKWLLDWAAENNRNLHTDGLTIHTTLDSRLQQLATVAVERQAAALQAVADVEWAQAGLRVSSSAIAPYAAAQPKVTPFAHLWTSRPELLSSFVRESPEFRKAAADSNDEPAIIRRLLADGEWVSRLKRAKSRLEAGFLAMDPRNGEVRAWVGSRDFAVDQYDHVAQAERQPGSVFKAFVYGAALQSGISPERRYADSTVELPMDDGSIWRPADARGPSNELMTLRDGLVHSRNSIAVQVSQEVGMARVVALAKAMGVDRSKLDPVPSLALGTSPVTLLEMVNAYATIANQGEQAQPVFIRRITDRHGTVLAEQSGATRRAMSSDNAIELIDMMRGVVARGTGTAMRTRFGIDADVAGKTGTTQNNTDGWFILMHPQLVAGAWVGFNDPRITMRSSYWGQGGHNAALLVGDFVRDAITQGSLDRTATFPRPRRPPPPAEPDLPLRSPEDASVAPASVAPVDPLVPVVQSVPVSPVTAEAVPASPPLQTPLAERAPLSAAELDRVVDLLNRSPAIGRSAATSGAQTPLVRDEPAPRAPAMPATP